MKPTPHIGRETFLARIQQALDDPLALGRSWCITGMAGMGKTRFLQACASDFGDAVVPVMLDLHSIPLGSESVLRGALVQAIHAALTGRGYSANRIPPPPDSRLAFQTSYLNEVTHIIRPHRRLLLLLDGAELLWEAIDGAALPADFWEAWVQVLTAQPQVCLVLAADTRAEERFAACPLLNPLHVLRLPRLSPGQCAMLIAASGLISLGATSLPLVNASGGIPEVLVQLIAALQATGNPDAALERTYQQQQGRLAAQFARLTASEQAVLYALAALHYEDPIAKRDADHVQRWLIERDMPVDLISLHSDLRALEYHDILWQQPLRGLAFVTPFWQRWLLQQQLGEPNAASAFEQATPSSERPLWQALLLVVALVLLGLLIALLLPPNTVSAPLVATATLAP